MQRINNNLTIQDSRRQGIALIMVLGVLTIITLLAVSFAITMRTERLAAENYVYVVKARQLLNYALSRAIFESDNYLGGSDPMMYPDFSQSGPPLTNAFVSFGTAEAPGDFLYGEVTNFIPRSVWEEAQTAMDHVEWARIKDPGSTNYIGRFAYLVLDCSGLLDANLVGGLDRGPGTNSQEITITSLDDVSPLGTFVTARDTSWIRFETLPELLYVDGLSPPSSNFFVYSRFIDDHLDPKGNPKIRVDQSAAALVDAESEILTALQDCNVNNHNDVYLNLIDYVDTDFIPGNKNGTAAADPLTFCTEPIPMINEISLSNSVRRVSSNAYEHTVYVTVETWYPFPEPPAGIYPTVTLVPPNLSVVSALPDGAMNPDPSAGNTVTVSVDPPSITPAAPNSFQMSTIKYTVLADPYIAGPVYGLQNMTFGNPLMLKFGSGGGGQDVDSAILPTPVLMAVNLTPALGVSETRFGVCNLPHFSCVDPRINWLPSHWTPIAGTPMAINANATGGEGPNIMYVRNEPMQSAAELGFLSVGDVWKTIALCRTNDTPTTDFHPVLDYFTTGPVATSTNKGLVNVNTRNADVLAAAFASLPVEEYPGDPSAPPLPWADAKVAAEKLIEYLWDNPSSHQISNDLSRIGAPWEIYNKEIDEGPAALLTDARRESLIRNTHRLLGVRQNIFTIILAAQATDNSDTVFGEQRAVAVVWRDPVPDADGRHPCFVRFFKLLAE
ncbi:MAG: hypothetical protein PHD86_00975 [Kiritimatiellae bacterium]|nr:hypothetical protein [Kiritimatiellia bacterium]